MSDNQDIPSEYKISEKWDKCLENFALHFGAGLVAGGLTSLVLARSGGGRGLITGFGAGAGTGSSWTTCQLAFAGNDEAQARLEKSEKVIEDLKEKIQKRA
ncbi:TPA: hypothetical protein N0F65_008189 [Lagenidium giganteum]|uniref:Cytochrome c oxidase assembly protein COX20, mitochondrial n=1 Tax=Lagenidium giganteum TaxID=4803 RepID=A0AAV2YJF9_9STRA|nr:TPA: hypothetical protein N0F65_008189 [Lagenidium giganteum]